MQTTDKSCQMTFASVQDHLTQNTQ